MEYSKTFACEAIVSKTTFSARITLWLYFPELVFATENKSFGLCFRILKKKIQLLTPFYKKFFWFETGKYYGRKGFWRKGIATFLGVGDTSCSLPRTDSVRRSRRAVFSRQLASLFRALTSAIERLTDLAMTFREAVPEGWH